MRCCCGYHDVNGEEWDSEVVRAHGRSVISIGRGDCGDIVCFEAADQGIFGGCDGINVRWDREGEAGETQEGYDRIEFGHLRAHEWDAGSEKNIDRQALGKRRFVVERRKGD